MTQRRGAIRVRHSADHAVAPKALPKVASRAMREPSVEDWLTRGRSFRHEVTELARRVPGNPNYPFLASPRGPRHGTLANWDWFVGDDFDAKILPVLLDVFDAEDDPILDLTAASALQALERLGQLDRWLDREPPLVIGAGRNGGLRIGAFNWTTDRDAFVAAMLGAPVPVRPRYSQTGPSEPVRLEGDLLDAREANGFAVTDALDLFGLSRAEAVASLGALDPVVDRLAAGGSLLTALRRVDSAAWAESPLGRYLLPLSRGAPRWRSPRLATEWAAAFDLGVVGVHGVAMWAPGAYELRKHRRAMAAHLRYLFDCHVSPWNRLPGPQRRQEALLVYWRRLAPVMGTPEPTIERICGYVRSRWPASYGAESPEVTRRRLYRMSRSIDPSRGIRRKRQRVTADQTPATTPR